MLAADAAVITKIVDLVNDQAKEITLPSNLSLDKREHRFTTKALQEILPAPPPLDAQVKVTTLQGLADLISNKLDGLEPNNFLIHVEDGANVKLITKATDEYGRRLALVHATPVLFDRFRFGEWLRQDDFVIKVAALFSDADAPPGSGGSNNDRSYVIKVAGSLTSGDNATSEVDAFTQRVTVKAGMNLPEAIEIKPFVNLAPYRIFPECQQIFSKFVFRAKVGDTGGHMLMLAEADGGLWKVEAINEVRRYLAVLATGIEIVA
jgi:hypothetical protein